MIRAIDIQESLLHLIGWEQNNNTSDFKIADALTQSETGLFYQQIHPLITLQNLSSITPDFKNIPLESRYSYENYIGTKQYAKSQIVTYEQKIYKSKLTTIGNLPTDIEYWYETSQLSEWIEAKTKASIQKAIMRYCNDKIAKGTYKTLCENRILFDGTGRLVDTVQNQNNLVGFEIIPVRSKGVTTKINKIGFQSDGSGEFDIYLYHSSSYEPIKTIHITKEKAGFIWITTDNLYLPYESDEIEAGGSWYLCYKQSVLNAVNQKAIRKDKDWSKEPCGSCSRREIQTWMAWSKYLEIHPFKLNEELSTDNKMWDAEDNIYTYDNNYGLNLDVSINCDITDFIIEQKMLFQDVIAKQVAIDMLREFAYNANVRTNRNSINASRVDILYEIDGDSSSLKKSGLSYQLDLAYKAIELSTEGIDRVCLPCKNNGIKYRSI